MVRMLSQLLLTTLLLTGMLYVNQAPVSFWLVGLGEQLLPILDGGVLTARVGETLVVRLLGRDGTLNIISPQGEAREVFIGDGVVTVLRKFSANDVGEWFIATDEGTTLMVVVEPPLIKPTVSLLVWLENTTVVATTATGPQAFALFTGTPGEDVYTPGSTMRIRVDGLNLQLLRFDLLRKADRVRYAGRLNEVPYQVELDQLVMSQVVQNRGGVFTVALPGKGASGPLGLKPISYGQYIVRLVTLGENRLVYEKEITVVPESFRGLNRLSRTLRVDFHEAMSRNFTLVVGDELGSIWFLNIRLPLMVFNVYDRTHSQRIDRYRLVLDNSSSSRVGDTTLLAFHSTLDITDYINGTYIEPIRVSDFTLVFDGYVSEFKEFEFRPGVSRTLDVDLYALVLRLVYPNGTVHRGPRTVEINNMTFREDGERVFLIPSEKYVIRALEPKSFAPTLYVHSKDAVLTILVLDNAEALASLRVSAILMSLLLGYTAYKVFRMRKTFYRARSR
ncbi:MAG: hypothetical protein NZ570_03685 [Candidatus Caldarchaeum sp.]|nr:hypothetical protein [Candidatus Caldarchaeum sp.]